MNTQNDQQTSDQQLAQGDIAWLINAIWEALQSPGWTFANRKDLEKLGEAIFSAKKLSQVDDKLLTRLLPHLRTIATHLGKALLSRQPQAAPSSEPPTAPPASETHEHNT
jgi:hypothetical protein